MSEKLFLCFYGDGPYWRDFVRLPAYPTDFSYVWPFRYDDRWIETSLSNRTKDNQLKNRLIGMECWLCARFRTSHPSLVLPIRKATLAQVNAKANNYSFFFRLGHFVDFPTAERLLDVCIDNDDFPRSDQANCLAFINHSDEGQIPFTDRDDEAWVRFADLLYAETELPIREEAKRSLYFHFEIPHNKNTKVPVSLLHTTHLEGDIYGAELLEGSSYEFVFSHRIPSLVGSHTAVGDIPLSYKLPTANVELNSPTGTIIGNYQDSGISLAAVRPSGTYEELQIVPSSEQLKSQANDVVLSSELSIPFKVKKSYWYRFKTKWTLVMLLWLSLSLLGLVNLFDNLIGPLLQGDIGFEDIWDNVMVIIVIVLISGAAAVLVFSLQERKN